MTSKVLAMMNNTVTTILLVALLALGCSPAGEDDGGLEPPMGTPPMTQLPPIDVRPFENQGVGIQFWERRWMPMPGEEGRADFIESLDRLTAMNMNFVHIYFNEILVGDQPNGVTFDRSSALSEAQFLDLMARLSERGFKVNFKVGFWHPAPGWSLGSYEPQDKSAWFANWTKELVYWAALAEQTGVDTFDIAYEMARLTTDPAYTDEWASLIDAVRAVYSGKITANFAYPVEAQRAVFLDRLDLVMTSVFYKHVPTGHNDPTVAELEASWTDDSTGTGNSVIDMNSGGEFAIDASILEEIEAIHTISGKPVMIGDMAFLSLDGAASNWNSSKGIEGNAVDEGEQDDQYEAFFRAATTELDPSWFKGVTFLTWFPFDSTDPAVPYSGKSEEIGPKGRSFRGKQAEQTIIEWYGGLR